MACQGLQRSDTAAPVPAGIGGNFQARPEPQLRQDVAHVALDRLGADAQPVPDFLIAQTLTNETDDFSLTLSDLRRVVQMVCRKWGATSSRPGCFPATNCNVASLLAWGNPPGGGKRS